MSSQSKWRESFQKTRSLSQTSVEISKQKTSLLEEGDLSVSDDELEEYLGTIKKKSGLNRLWTGNTFEKVIDRTPDVSISSVSDGEAPFDEVKSLESDNDFRPNIMALPSIASEDRNTDISEPSSVKPLQAVNFMSELELSDAPLELANNVKLTLDRQESVDVPDNDVKSISKDLSNVEEVRTLDEISEEIEEDLSQGSKPSLHSSHSSNKHRSKRPKDRQASQRSDQNTSNETDQSSQNDSERNYSQSKRRSKSRSESRRSRSSAKSKHSSQHTSDHSCLDSSRKDQKAQTNASSKKSEHSYTTDFSESSEQTETDSSSKSSLAATSAVSSTKLKLIEEMSKKTSKDTMNQCYHDVAIQVDMGDVRGQKLGVGMAKLGPSFGHQYVDPSPIACHAVSADDVEAVTAYNPAVVALTDMLRQQLRLVEQFVDNSRRMYESYTNNLNTTYRYTTLEDTLQYIDENRDRHS